MAIFKCKMCGGALEINNNETVVKCDYCGTQQTLPRLDDERRANLYDRANHFRRNNEFDKAMGIYEQILNEDSSDSEAYWSLVLCRYGIEYVEDPSSKKRIPTVNRAQFTSVFDDEDYKSAIKYADASQKSIYEEEANTINEIQKGILAISQKEEPFDVFICYKETDNTGRRTPDSVLANDLYHQLTREGFKVFFARITLEDKLGTAYEPYIFAALNSSKVMVVLGTKPEFFNAVWVKNEWSRYLALIKNGAGKMLIPAYRDMDPYDLPEEFSHLQAQDMSKLGFMQDLIRGIKKIAVADEPKQTVVKETVVSDTNGNTAPLLKRAFMFLEDGDWKSADEYCEKVLDIDPENAMGYLGKLMAELRVNLQENLKNCAVPFDQSANYQKALRFGDEKLKEELEGYVKHINDRNEEERKSKIYDNACEIMKTATNEFKFSEAANEFYKIPGYKDSDERAKICKEKAEIARKDEILSNGKRKMTGEVISDYEAAIKVFESISGYKDADEQIISCQNKIEEIKAKEEADRIERKRLEELAQIEKAKKRKRIKKIALITTPIVCLIVAFIIILNTVIIPIIKKNDFIAAYGQDVYDKVGLVEVGNYITFGTYEQDNNISNGKEDIEWLVLDIKDDRALVISKYALDSMPYSKKKKSVTWETCTLRSWLNNEFLSSAFSSTEKAMIPTVTVEPHANPKCDTNPGNATQVQVFLLSINEANDYFSSDSERACMPTDYAVANGASVGNGNCWWWVRSPGDDQSRAAIVGIDGDVYEYGSGVDFDGNAVRPALWIDLNS